MPSLFQRIACIVLVATSPALAHDRHGNAAMHQDVQVLIAKDHVEVTFQIETNEEGTFVEAIAMDANGDGKLSPEEQSGYFAQLDARLREGFQIVFFDKDVPLAPSSHVDLTPPSRKTFHFRGPVDSDSKNPAMFFAYNDNFLAWPGRTKLTMETSEELRKSVEFIRSSPPAHSGVVRLFEHAKPKDPELEKVNWGDWTWSHRLLTPLSITLCATILMLVACAIMLVGSPSTTRKSVGFSLIAVSLMGLGFAFLNPRKAPIPTETRRREFLVFHDRLSTALEKFHHNGNAIVLDSFGSSDVVSKLAKATRVADPNHDNIGTFELRRTRDCSTTILSTPRLPFNPILRIHHEWRAIGLMRHQGHPHERVRNFSCEYTLRVTDRGLQLLDCSDWHQLPDEPLE